MFDLFANPMFIMGAGAALSIAAAGAAALLLHLDSKARDRRFAERWESIGKKQDPSKR